MSTRPTALPALLAAATIACIAAPSGVAAPKSEPESAAAAEQSRTKGVPSFVVNQQDFALGRDRLIPVSLNAAAGEALTLETTSSDESVLRIVQPARFGAGKNLGFAIVRPLREGEATVRAGSATLQVRTLARPSAVLAEFDRPTIEGPSNGAAVWGKVSVGVSYWDLAPASDAAPHAEHGAWLLVQGLDPIRPARTTSADDGPLVHACFEFDAADLPEGPLRLIARIVDADGRERRSLPTVVRIVRAESTSLTVGECEEDYGIDEANPYDPRQQSSRGAVQRDGGASGGRYFSNAGTYPRFGFPVEVDSPGWYQLAVVAGADISMGTLPSIGIIINPANATDNRPVTSGPVLARPWHRLSLGTPFRLDAGRHTIRLHFMNDFYAGSGADRNLRLDRWELLRVADAAGPASATTGTGGMMAMQSAMMSGGDAMMAAAAPTADATMSMMSGSAAAAEAGGAWPASVAAMNATGEGPLRIAFIEAAPLLSMPGEIELRGALWMRSAERGVANAPRVALLINGVEVASQHSFSPRFRVRPDQLHAGVNAAVLTAVSEVGAAQSAVQRLMWRGFESAAAQRGPNPYHRFTLHDPAWSENAPTLRTGEKNPEDRASAGMHSNCTLALTLPEELEGEFAIEAEAIGQNFDGPAVLEFALVEGASEFDAAAERPAPFGTLRVPTTWWGPHEVQLSEPIRLARGPKRLLVSFVNDKYEEGKGDRNAWLAAVTLVAPIDQTTAAAPEVRMTYPHDNSRVPGVFGQGAVVAEPSSAMLVRRIELLIDGQPTGMAMDVARRSGPFVLQYSAAGLVPGRHALGVRAWQSDGRMFESSGREVEVLAGPPAEPTDYERTLILLDRFGFGPSQRDLAEALVAGPDAYLMQQLGATPDSEAEQTALALASIRFPNPRGEYDVVRRVLSHALSTPNPVRARFVLWAQNHFSTYIRKTEGVRKANEHAAFSALGVAPFGDLLRASATSPAMLRYLDQERSFARRINENYAREIMELHTLGVHGGYSQEDVTALACILTGWSTSGHVDGRTAPGGEGAAVERFRFDPRLSDPRERTVLGFMFAESPARERFARVDAALELLASHPATARFVCGKLAEHYCCSPAPEDLVADLASTFIRTSGDMQAVMLEMARHPAFWREAAKRRVAHPLDFGIRMARVTGETNAHAVGEFLQSSGQGLFERPTPDGYPEADADAMSSNAMLQRWRLARRAEWQLASFVPGELRYVDRSRDEPSAAESRRIIETIALRLTGRALDERSLTAAMSVLAGTTGQRDERIRAVATFIAQLPEAGVK